MARELLGKGLLVRNRKVECLAEIVEVEAYLGDLDPASHAYRGLTRRNWPMFEKGGACYVYLSYGINYCMNVVTGPQGLGEAVLLRAAVPLLGMDEMIARRKLSQAKLGPQLTNGPGKLTQAMGIDLSHNGLRFGEGNLDLVDLGRSFSRTQIGASSRIGISKGREHLFRFFVNDSPWISRKRVDVF